MSWPNTIPDPAVVVDTVIVGLTALASPNNTVPAPLSVIDPELDTFPNNCKILLFEIITAPPLVVN
jgi:hypothetical protein